MRLAGLNPILAGKMGGASTPGGASYVAQKETPVESGVASANSYMQNKQLSQNIDINKHSRDFANFTGIPIEQANPIMKAGYSAKYMAGKLPKFIKDAEAADKKKNKGKYKKAPIPYVKKEYTTKGSKTFYKGKSIYPDRILRTTR